MKAMQWLGGCLLYCRNLWTH